MMQSYEVIAGTEPELALFEIRDGKYWDGKPFTSGQDGFYVAERTSNGDILNNSIFWGPYPNAARAKIAVRNVTILTELERKGRVRRVVRDNGKPAFNALESYQTFLLKVLTVIVKYETVSTDTIANALHKQGEMFTDEEFELGMEWLTNGGHVRRAIEKDEVMRYEAVKPDQAFMDNVLRAIAECAKFATTGEIAKILREQGKSFSDKYLDLVLKNLTDEELNKYIDLALKRLTDEGLLWQVGCS